MKRLSFLYSLFATLCRISFAAMLDFKSSFALCEAAAKKRRKKKRSVRILGEGKERGSHARNGLWGRGY